MKKVIVFLADGFEEVEALTTVDLLRRVNANVITMSITSDIVVCGAHDIIVNTDSIFDKKEIEDADAVVLPGGMPGTLNLKNHRGVEETVLDFEKTGKLVCAICAAPMILGELGLLKGKRACCYPGMEEYLKGAVVEGGPVSVDGNIITGVGVGGAIAFALEIVKYLFDEETAKELKESIVDKF
ncbi:MAG: DJ-1/PfpI family protein [Firmicutes bacterium]|nr:DJ-1/PfpI family protein [Bacillota bacterium]